jgi:hypothetical protein
MQQRHSFVPICFTQRRRTQFTASLAAKCTGWHAAKKKVAERINTLKVAAARLRLRSELIKKKNAAGRSQRVCPLFPGHLSKLRELRQQLRSGRIFFAQMLYHLAVQIY